MTGKRCPWARGLLPVVLMVLLACWVWIGTSLGESSQEQTGLPGPPFPPDQPPPMSGPLPPGPVLPPQPGAPLNAPPLKMVSPGVFEIGGCRILKASGEVEFPAQVNMQKGLLEYLVVGGMGKLHESLLRTDVEPYALQIALLLLGLEGSVNPLPGQGASNIPEGDPVSIWIQWTKDGQKMTTPIEAWVVKGQEAVDRLPWVFTGSVVRDGVFWAQMDKSIVAIYHDPSALIDHQLAEGASDEIWFVSEAKTPAVGTPVTVIVKKEAKGQRK